MENVFDLLKFYNKHHLKPNTSCRLIVQESTSCNLCMQETSWIPNETKRSAAYLTQIPIDSGMEANSQQNAGQKYPPLIQLIPEIISGVILN